MARGHQGVLESSYQVSYGRHRDTGEVQDPDAPTGPHQRGLDVKVDEKGWHVTVTETADGHVFLSASSDKALWMAIDKAESEIPEALKSWGYKDES